MPAHYERLSYLDNSFLALEARTTHMHVAGIAIFDAGPLQTDDGGEHGHVVEDEHVALSRTDCGQRREGLVGLDVVQDGVAVAERPARAVLAREPHRRPLEQETAEGERLAALVKRKMVICFDVHDPDVEMWVDGRHDPVQTSFGPNDQKATLTARLSGDSLHELLLGTLPLGRALTSGRLKVKGSKLKAMRLEDLLHGHCLLKLGKGV